MELSRREWRDNILISVALLIAAFVMYLQEDNGWVLGVTMVISAFVTFGAYWLGRWYKARVKKQTASGEGS